MRNANSRYLLVALVAAIGVSGALAQAPLGTGITYQGYLVLDNVPVDPAADFRFRLYDAQVGGVAVSALITRLNEPVADGLFTVHDLDFGAAVFDGDDVFLQIYVRVPPGVGGYTALSPRQRLSPAAYALYSTKAPWSGLVGTPSTFPPGGPAGGDLTGTYPNPTVDGLRGRPVSSTAPSAGEVLEWTGGAWAPGTDDDGDLTLPYSGTYGGGLTSFAIDSSGLGRTMWLERTNTGGGNSTLRADNAGDFAAVYAYGDTAQSWGVRAHHGPSSNRADLATEDYAGDFDGDVVVDGEIWKRYGANTKDPAAPLAYAYVMSNSTINANTPNVTTCTWNSTYDRYEITISGESYYYNDYVTVVTPSSSYIPRVSSVGGKLLVYFVDSSGNPKQVNFQFVTYKPNGSILGDCPASPDPAIPDDEWAEQVGYSAEFVHEFEEEMPAAPAAPGSDLSDANSQAGD